MAIAEAEIAASGIRIQPTCAFPTFPHDRGERVIMRIPSKTIFSSICVAALAVTAHAQAPDEDASKTAPPTPSEALPPPTSDRDPAPPVARPDVALPPGGLVEQAGIGGTVGYGRAGVLELGGSAGLVLAADFRNVNVSPSIGWFIADNFQLSGILGVSHVNVEEDGVDNDATVFSALVEPSYHLPFNRSMFGFLGLGVGGSYISSLGGGFALAPRIGANFLVGRSGILTPSLSYEYTTHSIDDAGDDMGRDLALVAVSSALRVNVGYPVMW
jgi:hypothetical protein